MRNPLIRRRKGGHGSEVSSNVHDTGTPKIWQLVLFKVKITYAKELDETKNHQMLRSKLQVDSKTVGILIALCSITWNHDPMLHQGNNK